MAYICFPHTKIPLSQDVPKLVGYRKKIRGEQYGKILITIMASVYVCVFWS